MELHRTPECAGNWSMVPNLHPALWECDVCRARVLDLPDIRRALLEEEAAGAILAWLAADGAVLLGRGRWIEAKPSP